MNLQNVLWAQFDMRTNSILDANCTHVFKIETDNYFKKIQCIYPELLHTKELLKASRFKQLRDQQNYISRRCFLRLLLSKILLVEASKIEYEQIGNKKPRLKGIEFNTTHSGNLAFIAISKLPIGIDAELKKEDFDFDSLLADCFSQEEVVVINTGDRKTNFYSLWTRKEAILKATAEGLIDDLKQINALPATITRKGEDFHVHTLAVDDTHMLSIACTSPVEKIRFWAD